MVSRISEAELEQIFINHRYKKPNKFGVFLKLLLFFVAIFCFVFFTLNYQALSKKILFWYDDQFNSKKFELTNVIKTYNNENNSKTTFTDSIPDNTIYIESINVKAPIIFNVENSENSVAENLKNGVIQIKNSSLPGESGNVFITGHSSNFPWVKSNFNTIFALLDKMVIGDLVLIKYQNQVFVYKARRIYTVNPDNTSILEGNSTNQALILMTCVPVGTNLQRLIIELDQIVPLPTSNPDGNKSTTILPEINR